MANLDVIGLPATNWSCSATKGTVISIHTTGYIIRIIPVVINHKILLVLGIYARCSSIYGGDSDGQIRICSWYPCDVDCIRLGRLVGFGMSL